MDEKEVTITLKVSQWNIVMSALGKAPFENVVNVVNDIKVQADAQLNTISQTSE